MRKRFGFTIVVTAAVLQMTAGGVHAQSVCKGLKMKAIGKDAACIAGVYSTAAAKGLDPVNDLKVVAGLAKCDTKLTAAFTKAETKPGCDTNADAAHFVDQQRRFMWGNVAQLCVMRDPSILSVCVAPVTAFSATCAHGCSGGVNQGQVCTMLSDCPSATCDLGFRDPYGICGP